MSADALKNKESQFRKRNPTPLTVDDPFLKRSRIDDRPRMFGVLESLDDEDIQEDADAYQQKLEAGSSDSEKDEEPIPYGPLLHCDILSPIPPASSSPIVRNPDLTTLSSDPVLGEPPSLDDSSQQNEPGLVEGYGSSSEEEKEEHSGAQNPVSVSALQKLGLKDPSKLETIAAQDIRDKNWAYTSNGVWTPAKMPVEHGTHQKRKHQITWLASSAVEDEQRIQDLAQKARENRHKSRLKYGF
eukprot:Protomagalhaensia_sp_Gyna_25__5246@NODE_63_length_5749_cov_361_425919_g46_i0_p3_GENE_NODE_63_length_5749_cov_361_425919_g46_i0NODE_63_length_5749_cov_361_425919_g46_i0_p3_ORF_typecomplete_len243_score50_08PRCC/PF10253_9/1_4e08PGC7_Stella/PF15549_6/7_4e03PGC7_Stella/PF15549_6/0_012_NODE_63_length_5749_cov_361_425919_g46_i038784606